MSPNDGLELLIFNTERVQVWHFHILASVEETVDTHDAVAEGTWTREQGVVFLLSDALKEKYEMMIDDIEVRHIAGHPPYMKEFRQDLIRELAHAALAVVDWHALAREIIHRKWEGEMACQNNAPLFGPRSLEASPPRLVCEKCKKPGHVIFPYPHNNSPDKAICPHCGHDNGFNTGDKL